MTQRIAVLIYSYLLRLIVSQFSIFPPLSFPSVTLISCRWRFLLTERCHVFLVGKARWSMALLLFCVWLGSFNSLISGEQTEDKRESRCYSSHPRSIQTSLQLLCFCSCLINQWKHATKCVVFIAPCTKYCNVNTITMKKLLKHF